MAGKPRRKDDNIPPEIFTQQVEAARLNRELINRLARWRAEHELTQAEVAKRMHTSQPAVVRLEYHKHDAQLSTLARYAAALGLKIDFVIRDRETGAQVWSSFTEGRQYTAEDAGIANESEQTASSAQSAASEVTIFDDTWNKLSERDLERQPYVIAAAEEPGWNLVYATSGSLPLPSEIVTEQDRRMEQAEDPNVVGVFGPKDTDPIVIATAPGAMPNQPHLIHTLVAKIRDVTDDIEQESEAPTDVSAQMERRKFRFAAAIKAIREALDQEPLLIEHTQPPKEVSADLPERE